MNPEKEITKIIQEFSALSSWEERYNKLIQMGKLLPPLDDQYKIEDLKIKGCQSQVWLRVERDSTNGQLVFSADSDALIVKGLIALLLKVYSHRSADEILNIEPTFIKEIGLDAHLTPSRTNGLYSMVKQIKYYALAFKAL